MATLLERGLVSQSDYDQADAKAKMAAARVESAVASVANAQARLSSSQVEYARTFIRAPFTGTILRKEAEVARSSSLPRRGSRRGAIVTWADLARSKWTGT